MLCVTDIVPLAGVPVLLTGMLSVEPDNTSIAASVAPPDKASVPGTVRVLFVSKTLSVLFVIETVAFWAMFVELSDKERGALLVILLVKLYVVVPCPSKLNWDNEPKS